MKAEPPGIDKQAPCVCILDCTYACAPVLLPSCQNMAACLFVCAYCDRVGGDPWSGSPVTGAHLRFGELSSQCAKQPPEDRISYCDPAQR